MTVFIRETSGDDLTPYLKENESILLRRGRSNTVRVNGEHLLEDVRTMHISSNDDGTFNIEFHCQYSEEDGHHISVNLHNVTTVVVQWMGWSDKFPSYYGGIYDSQIDIDHLKDD